MQNDTDMSEADLEDFEDDDEVAGPLKRFLIWLVSFIGSIAIAGLAAWSAAAIFGAIACALDFLDWSVHGDIAWKAARFNMIFALGSVLSVHANRILLRKDEALTPVVAELIVGLVHIFLGILIGLISVIVACFR